MSEENNELCPKCGQNGFVITRNMRSTRCCKCGETWIPNPKENKTVFDINDRVTAFGVEGVVVSVDCDVEDYYPIKVKFYNGQQCLFTKDGRSEKWHLEPSLKLIEKAKKKVTKTIERWVNVYPGFIGDIIFHSEKEAILHSLGPTIACVKLTGSYEVEE